ncbi:SDR family NAD(P)-dependent oxidoreductase [Actinomadura sp. 9N407]|uniref:SDR family NAD(P)-dependent oxidoreductase n=1 Tax=Actinomadura sp. 9N407 TaxID=3375154 RepID=UPI0037AC5F2B
MTTDQKVALVTGANKGIGKAVCRQLADLGMVVLATARDADRGRAAVADLVAGGGDVRFVRLDVTAEDTVRAVAEHVAAEFGRLDLLINNAGVTGVTPGRRRPLDEVTVQDLRDTLETNFVGVFAVTQALLPLLRGSGGRIVNLTSTLSSFARVADGPPPADLIPYCTAKAATNLLSVMYAGLLRDSGVTACAVSPGFVATDMNNFTGPKTVEEGAEVVVRYATAAPEDLPDRAFLTGTGTHPW